MLCKRKEFFFVRLRGIAVRRSHPPARFLACLLACLLGVGASRSQAQNRLDLHSQERP
jgi:hypothetical protein